MQSYSLVLWVGFLGLTGQEKQVQRGSRGADYLQANLEF